MPNISANELHQMRLSGQPVRTQKLMTILMQYGFDTRHCDGSHIVYWHPDYPEISPEVIVAGTDNILYQRFVIDSCLKAIELSKKIDLVAPVSLAPDFKKTAEDAFSYTLPEQFEIIRGRKKDSLYLRHKTYPQIATELLHYKRGQDISEWCGYLEERAGELDAVLKKAVEDHDFERTRYSNGTIVLMHPKNEDAYIVLPPFAPRLENYKCISRVEDCIAIVQSFKQEYDPHIQEWIEKYQLKTLPAQKEGLSTYEFDDGFRKDKPLYVSFHKTRNGYYSYIDFLKFTDDIDRQAWGNYKTLFLQGAGIRTKKLTDGRIHGKHVFADIEFTIPDFTGIKLDEKLKVYAGLTKEERTSMTEKFLKDSATRDEAKSEMNKAMQAAYDLNQKLAAGLYDITETSLSDLKMDRDFTYGEVSRISARNKIGSKHIEFDVVFLVTSIHSLRYKSMNMMVVPRPSDLERLKHFAYEASAPHINIFRPSVSLQPSTEFRAKSILEMGKIDQPVTRASSLKTGTSIMPDFFEKKI